MGTIWLDIGGKVHSDYGWHGCQFPVNTGTTIYGSGSEGEVIIEQAEQDTAVIEA